MHNPRTIFVQPNPRNNFQLDVNNPITLTVVRCTNVLTYILEPDLHSLQQPLAFDKTVNIPVFSPFNTTCSSSISQNVLLSADNMASYRGRVQSSTEDPVASHASQE